MLPDHAQPRVYALNRANGSVPGTLLALNSTHGAMLAEIPLNLSPTDMAITPAGDGLYVIHAGSRSISKVDLASFGVVGEMTISTPSAYDPANPLYVVAGQSDELYYTDGAWGPQIYLFDFNTGTSLLVLDTGGNQYHGAGGMRLNRSGNNLYIGRQYGWSAGAVNSWVTRLAVNGDGTLTALEDSFSSWRRDPFDTPLFLDAGERWVFNKQQMFLASVTGSDWLTLGANQGVAPGTLAVHLETASLSAGEYTNTLAFQVGGTTLLVPDLLVLDRRAGCVRGRRGL